MFIGRSVGAGGGGGHLLLTLLYAVTVEVQFNMFCEE